ncbi:MAG TPA: glycosyltransferase family 4 protein [Rhodopila sp.]
MTSQPNGPPRRVLLVNRVGYLGGVERIILTLATGLGALGWTPVLACPGEGDLARAAREQAIEVAPCGFDRMRITANPKVFLGYPMALLNGSRDIQRHCRVHAIDVIHAHHPVTALYAARAARSLGIPLVLHVHETLPARPLYGLAMRLALRHATSVLCVSGAARKLALALGAPAERTRVVYNGVDPQFLEAAPPRPAPSVLRAGGGPHVGLFGVLEPRKAPHVFLEAASSLARQFPAAHFWLVGPAALKDKQDYVDALRRRAEMPDLSGRVSFTGFQADVAPWLAAMDVVAQTSVALESFGMAAAEALSLGRPVVATDVGGLPEVVRDGETGLIVPPGDAARLAWALGHFLASPAARARFGDRGAIDSRARFAPSVFRADVARAYEEACR